MARSRSPWRALRPVLLAGAATLTWLTFSSTPASADTLSDSSSLLGGVTSSVHSVSEKVLGAVPGVPSTAGAQPAGLLQPVAGSVAGVADDLLGSLPVVRDVVPPGTVSAVTTPVVRIADGATSAVVETVVPPVTDSVPVLEPVLDPVTDLITGTHPLPGPAPVLPGTPAEDDKELPVGPGSGASTAVDTAKTNAELPVPGTGQPATTHDGSFLEASVVGAIPASRAGYAGQEVRPGALTFPWPGSSGVPLPVESPGSVDPSPRPGPVPAAPGVAGAGSGAGAWSGSSGSAAWLNFFDFNLAFIDADRVNGHSESIPDPVSFDPGSSPD